MLTKKYAFFLAFCILLLGVLSTYTYAGCCKFSTICDYDGLVTTQSGCTGTNVQWYNAQDCFAVPDCEPVCCCFNGTAENPQIISKFNCKSSTGPYEFKTYSDLGITSEQKMWTSRETYADDCSIKCGQTPINVTEKKYNLSGTVTNATSRQALEGVTVYCPVEYGIFWTITDEYGKYELLDIPKGLHKIYLKKRGCLDNSTDNWINFDGNMQIDLSIGCNIPACTIPSFTITSATQKSATASIYLEWNYSDKCGNLIEFVVTRCTTNCTDFLAGRNNYLTDLQDIQPNTKYWYNVTAITAEGRIQAPSVYVTTGDLACMRERPAEFCYNNNRTTCNNNTLRTIQECGINNCFTKPDLSTECVVQSECEKCNGIFGMFALLNPKLNLPGIGDFPCNYTTLTHCYYDRSLTSVDKFYNCSQAQSCYNYMSKDTCAGNPCKISESCSWQDLKEELGIGVCRPSNEEEVDCGKCTEIYGEGCSESVCSAFGSCYMHQLSKGLYLPDPVCLGKSDMACAYYDTEADCIHSPHNLAAKRGQVSVNTNWFGSVRVGGNNIILRNSSDYFGLGKCRWVNDTSIGDYTNGRCVKDADNYTKYSEYYDDCIEEGITGFTCLGDNEPPRTTLLLKNSGNYKASEFVKLSYVVQDNKFPRDMIDTYFCLAKSSAPADYCYPDKQLSEMNISDTKVYTIYYYSADPAKNLEPVKSTTLTIEEDNFPYIINYTIT